MRTSRCRAPFTAYSSSRFIEFVKDFRSQVVKTAPTVIDIDGLLKEGQLAKALRKARAAGFTLPQQQIDATAAKLFRSGRAAELLSLIGSLGLPLPLDTPTLLRRASEACDYHTLLKQALSLGPRAGFVR